MKSWIVMTTCTLSLLTQGSVAQVNSRQQLGPPLGLRNVEMTVRLMSPISTRSSRSGERFSAQVLTPATYSGAFIEGHIASIRAARNQNKSEITFQFETLTFKGVTHVIQADLKAVANSQGVAMVDEEGRPIGKSSKKKTVESALIGSAFGGILGGVLGGARGAAIGAGAGAGAGLLFAIKFTTSGSQIEFAPGSTFTLVVSDRGQR